MSNIDKFRMIVQTIVLGESIKNAAHCLSMSMSVTFARRVARDEVMSGDELYQIASEYVQWYQHTNDPQVVKALPEGLKAIR